MSSYDGELSFSPDEILFQAYYLTFYQDNKLRDDILLVIRSCRLYLSLHREGGLDGCSFKSKF